MIFVILVCAQELFSNLIHTEHNLKEAVLGPCLYEMLLLLWCVEMTVTFVSRVLSYTLCGSSLVFSFSFLP